MNNENLSLSQSKKKRLNELDGRTWARYSISLWDVVKTPDETKLKHPAMFPVKLCERLIEIYTKPGDIILDPLMGSGSVLVAAKKLARKGIGFDVVEDYVRLTQRRLSKERVHIFPRKYRPLELYLSETNSETKSVFEEKKELAKLNLEPQIYCEDAKNLNKYVHPNSVDLCITSPPYWNIHTRQRTADYKEPRPYSLLEGDLGNIEDFDAFMKELKSIFRKVHTILKHIKKCIIIVMDIRQASQFLPFHMHISNMMTEIGFILEDIIIWDRRKEYSNLRPLGYPYAFIVNKVHEYILIFRKDKVEGFEETSY